MDAIKRLIAIVLVIGLLVGVAIAINPGSQIDPAQAVIISATPAPTMGVTPVSYPPTPEFPDRPGGQ